MTSYLQSNISLKAYLAEVSHRVQILFTREDTQATPEGLCLVHISDNTPPRGCHDERDKKNEIP